MLDMSGNVFRRRYTYWTNFIDTASLYA